MAEILSPLRLAEYRLGVDRLWGSVYMKYPRHVHIETLTLCPAACTFCPYPTVERQGTRMSDALIGSIFDQLAEIPRHVRFQLSPFLLSDPFVDSRLFELLRAANERLPNAVLALTTSGVPLTPAVLGRLASINNIAYLWISLNEYRAPEYQRLMSVDFDRTIRNIDHVDAKFRSGDLPFKVVVSRVADGSADDDAFVAWVSARYPALSVVLFNRSDWLRQVDTAIGVVPDIPCSHWFELCITATGVVALCCMDGKAEWAIGDVTKERLLDVYNKPRYRDLRLRARSRLEVEPCRGCTLL